MSDSEERIREMVRAAVEENPRITNKVLFERARAISANAVEGLTPRQFHGKFRLPVARALSGAGSPAKPKRRRAARSTRMDAGGADESKRDAVREIFRRFAVQLSRAEGRSEIVRAAARIDEFVEEVFRTLGAPDGTDAPTPAKRQRGRKSARPAADALPPADATAPTASASSAPATALVGEPPARDMRRRRRPKASLKAAPTPEPAAPAEEAPSPVDETGPPPSEPPAAPERSATFNLSHDLEEFRRRKYERERGGRRLP